MNRLAYLTPLDDVGSNKVVILNVGQHLYNGHDLFGTKQQRTLGPSHDEQYLGSALRGEQWWRSATGRRVAWQCSLWGRGRSTALGQMVRNLAAKVAPSPRAVRTVRALGRTVRDGVGSSSSPRIT
jgi:hypothetical protein